MRAYLLHYWNLPADAFAALLANLTWTVAIVGLVLMVILGVYLTLTRRRETKARQQALAKLRY